MGFLLSPVWRPEHRSLEPDQPAGARHYLNQ
jgi:hypothetical protein